MVIVRKFLDDWNDLFLEFIQQSPYRQWLIAGPSFCMIFIIFGVFLRLIGIDMIIYIFISFKFDSYELEEDVQLSV